MRGATKKKLVQHIEKKSLPGAAHAFYKHRKLKEKRERPGPMRARLLANPKEIILLFFIIFFGQDCPADHEIFFFIFFLYFFFLTMQSGISGSWVGDGEIIGVNSNNHNNK